MQEIIKKVRFDGKDVGSITIPIYTNVAELAEKEPTENILAQFNKGNTITLMANERNKHKPATTGKQARAFIGFNQLTTEEAISCQGDPEALRTLIESDKIQTRIDAFLEERNPSSDNSVTEETEE